MSARLVPGPRACRQCGVVKPLDEFSTNPSVSNGRQAICRLCNAANVRRHRAANPSVREREKVRIEARRRENMRRLHDYLAAHPCVDCGAADPIVLEFDHVRGDKRAPISHLLNRAWPNVADEIGKCDVRCANCHRRRTASQFGWYAYLKESAS